MGTVLPARAAVSGVLGLANAQLGIVRTETGQEVTVAC